MNDAKLNVIVNFNSTKSEVKEIFAYIMNKHQAHG